MKTKPVSLIVLLLFAVFALRVVTASTVRGNRPNMVIILADDLGWGDIGYHGGRVQTPNIDMLAREGVRLELLDCRALVRRMKLVTARKRNGAEGGYHERWSCSRSIRLGRRPVGDGRRTYPLAGRPGRTGVSHTRRSARPRHESGAVQLMEPPKTKA